MGLTEGVHLLNGPTFDPSVYMPEALRETVEISLVEGNPGEQTLQGPSLEAAELSYIREPVHTGLVNSKLACGWLSRSLEFRSRPEDAIVGWVRGPGPGRHSK